MSSFTCCESFAAAASISSGADRIVFGLLVTVQDLDSGEECSYQIVGMDEADITVNRISVSSPVARALIGKTVGDVVQVQIPRGLRELEVLEISNP